MSNDPCKIKLINRLRELGLRLDSIEEALEAPHSRDWEEMAVEREGEEVLERLGTESQSEIARILAALRRIETGDYGLCQSCGESIQPERLEILPDTPLCRNCASGRGS